MRNSDAKDLCKLLSISPGITSVIGSGGKTTLLSVLSKALPGTVLLSTSTHILPFTGCPLLTSSPGETAEELIARLKDGFLKSRVLCLGSPGPDGKLSAPPLPFSLIAPVADFCLVEADGSASLPMKAHAEYEPVIPAGSRRTILIAGASAFFRPIKEVCHRPEIFCRLTGASPKDTLTPALAAALINKERLSDFVFLNQTDALANASEAETFLNLIDLPGHAGSLIIMNP